MALRTLKKKLDLSDRKHDWKLKWGHLMIMFTEANWELYNGHTDLTIHSAINNVSSWEQCVCLLPHDSSFGSKGALRK